MGAVTARCDRLEDKLHAGDKENQESKGSEKTGPKARVEEVCS